MLIELGIGNGSQKIEIEEKNLLGILVPEKIMIEGNEENLIRTALEKPIHSQQLRELVHPGEKIAIITSDITRPLPSWKLLPPLLDELYRGGIRADDISIIFALGIHRKQTEAEKRKLVGERVYKEICCFDSDPEACVLIGRTSRGTPVEIDRRVVEADRRICLGNIEFHYFAGYSGGAKAIMPGVSTRAAIQANHCRMVQKEACAGKLVGNPVREDIEEAASMVGVDFILNVVLNPEKEIIYAVAGNLIDAHRVGCDFLDQIYRKKQPQLADIVIVSQGGAPKDLNLYQTQKALDNARHAVKNGGIIILLGSCREGMGEPVFEAWMKEARSPEEILTRLQSGFCLGGHKAAAIAKVLRETDVYLVSDMEPDFVRSIFMEPYASVEEAYQAALRKLGKTAKVMVMPFGGSTLPFIEE